MAVHKLIWEDQNTEPITVLALHCNEEDFKIAFILNKKLKITLKRQKEDYIIKTKTNDIAFSVFEFTRPFSQQRFYLIKNKTTTQEQKKNIGLFKDNLTPENQVHFFLNEYKKPDYILKINDTLTTEEMNGIIKEIKEIKEIFSVYLINQTHFKNNPHICQI